MSSKDDRMERMRERFWARSRLDRVALQQALANGDNDELRRLAHGLAGAGGVFGYPTLSTAASALEGALDRGEPGDHKALALLSELEAVDTPGES